MKPISLSIHPPVQEAAINDNGELVAIWNGPTNATVTAILTADETPPYPGSTFEFQGKTWCVKGFQCQYGSPYKNLTLDVVDHKSIEPDPVYFSKAAESVQAGQAVALTPDGKIAPLKVVAKAVSAAANALGGYGLKEAADAVSAIQQYDEMSQKLFSASPANPEVSITTKYIAKDKDHDIKPAAPKKPYSFNKPRKLAS